jgi:hypothetical protein
VGKNKTKLAMLFFAVVITMTTVVTVADEYMHYKVLKGDRVIDILRSLKLKPIFGKKGYLKEVISLNPKAVKRRGNLILPGDELVLPVKIISKSIATEVEAPRVIHEELAVIPLPLPQSEKFKQYSFFKIAPQFSWVAIHSVDDVHIGGTDVSDLTDPSIGIKGEWRIMIRPEASLYLYSSVNLLRFYKDATYQLSNTSFTRTSFGLGGDYDLSTVSKLVTTFQVNQNYFLEVVSPTDIQIRSLTQAEFKTEYSRNLFSIDRVQSDWAIGGILILPSSRDLYKASVGYGFTLDWKTRFLSKELEVGYTHKFFKVNDISNQSKEFFGSLNFQFGREE